MECSQPRILRGTAVSGALVSSFEEGIAERANGCIQVLKYRVKANAERIEVLLHFKCSVFSIQHIAETHAPPVFSQL